MPRWTRISLKILASLLGLVLVLWVALGIYVSRNKKQITDAVVNQLNDNLNGDIEIGTIEPSLLKGFPFVSFSITDVAIRDTLWQQHRRDLLKAKELFVKLNILSVLRSAPQIHTIDVNIGTIAIFVDSTGYSNTSVFAKKEKGKGKKEKPHINNIELHDVVVRFEDQVKFKLFQLQIRELDGALDYSADGWEGVFGVNALVKHFAFNTEKGSFLKDKELKTTVKISYNDVKRIMDIPVQRFAIGGDDYRIGGKFYLNQTPTAFELHIINDKARYRNVTALLSPNISSKLNSIDFEKPISVQALIKGKVKFRDTPLVKVSYNIANNTMKIPDAEIKNCSFKGHFINEVNPTAGHNDPNSAIHIYSMKGQWEGIPITADTVRVYNLIDPILEGRFRSQFALAKLNDILGGNSFRFDNGTAKVNLLYRAGIRKDDTSRKYIYGTIQVGNANMTYIPRRLKLNNCNAVLRFTGDDLLIQKVNVRTANTSLAMDGRIGNFANLYYTQPEKILLDWHITSPQVNLDEFLSFIGKRGAGDKNTMGPTQSQPSKPKGNKDIAARLDKVLDESSVHMRLEVGKLLYKRFTAEQIQSNISLTQAGIGIQYLGLSHAGGRITASGNIQQNNNNRFDVKTNIDNVNIKQLFHAFENFGQDAITEQNIQGNLTTAVNITGNMRDNGQIVPASMHGTVDFDLQNGRLVNFEPLNKVARFIFRNRNLNDIELRKLKNTLDIQGNKVYIRPMTVESSAINIFLRGVYSMQQGTHIEMDIPLRNSKKDEFLTNPDEKQEKMKKGLTLHLKAVDGDDGKVKIKWNKKDERSVHYEAKAD
ncbi:MAG: hypothetical protein EOP56_15635 [Sphingobacteriales bacterium]|nr:MAG: hypothetical protein EOP56_15635 [Sphingobacteriales bacterium]